MASSEYTSVRIFVSSTFRDQQSTRTVLSRSVVPRLEEWGTSWYINIQLVDLRWGGVTPEESAQGKAVELCLQEVDRADVVLAIVGQRYGWTPDDYLPNSASAGLSHPRATSNVSGSIKPAQVGSRRVSFVGPDSDDDEAMMAAATRLVEPNSSSDRNDASADVEEDPLEWVRQYPKGRSITELELYRAALNNTAKHRASKVQQTLFYIQDGSWLDKVPDKHKGSFIDGELEVVGYRRLSAVSSQDEGEDAMGGEQRIEGSEPIYPIAPHKAAGPPPPLLGIGRMSNRGSRMGLRLITGDSDDIEGGSRNDDAGSRAGSEVSHGRQRTGSDGAISATGSYSMATRPASRLRRPIYKFEVDAHKAELLRKLRTRIRLAASRRSDVTLVDKVPCEYRPPAKPRKHVNRERTSSRNHQPTDLEQIKHYPRIGGLSRWAEDVLYRLRLAVAKVVAGRRARDGADPALVEQMAHAMASNHGEGRDSAQMASGNSSGNRGALIRSRAVLRSTRTLGSDTRERGRDASSSRQLLAYASFSSGTGAGVGNNADAQLNSASSSVHRDAEASAWRYARRSSEQVCALLNIRTVGRSALVDGAVDTLVRSQPVPLWHDDAWRGLLEAAELSAAGMRSRSTNDERSSTPGHSSIRGRTGVPDLDGEIAKPTVGLSSASMLFGPPGVGKTSLLASMAHALRRSVEKAVGPARAGSWRPAALFEEHEDADGPVISPLVHRQEAPAIITHLVGMGGGSSVQVRDVIQRLCVELRRVAGPGLPSARTRGRTTGGREVECALAWLSGDLYSQEDLQAEVQKRSRGIVYNIVGRASAGAFGGDGGTSQRRAFSRRPTASSLADEIGATRVGESTGDESDDGGGSSESSDGSESYHESSGNMFAGDESFTTGGRKRTRYGADFSHRSSYDELLAEYEWEYDPPPLPDDPRELRSILTGLLELAAARRPVVLIIDAVDDMQDVVLGQRAEGNTRRGDSTAVARQSVLDVLPHKQLLPARVHVIVSVRTDPPSADFDRDGGAIGWSNEDNDHHSISSLEARGYTPVALRPLTNAAARRAAIAMLRRHGKRMESAQLDALSSRVCSRLPLWLAVSTEELRVFGVYEKVLDRIEALPDSLMLLFDQYLERLEIDHGKAVVATVATLLVASNEPGGGRLSEEELYGIMAFPPLIWTSLRLALRPYLAGSITSDGIGEELVAIAVGPLVRAVRRRYWGHPRAGALEPEYIPSHAMRESSTGEYPDRSQIMNPTFLGGPLRDGSAELDALDTASADGDSIGASSIGEIHSYTFQLDNESIPPGGDHQAVNKKFALRGRSVVASATRALPGPLGSLGRLLVSSSPHPRSVHLFLAGFLMQRALGHGVSDSALHASVKDMRKSLKAVVSSDAGMRAAAEARARSVYEASMAADNTEKAMALKRAKESYQNYPALAPEPGSQASKVAAAKALMGHYAESDSDSSSSDDSIDWFFNARLKTTKYGNQDNATAVQNAPSLAVAYSLSLSGTVGRYPGLDTASKLSIPEGAIPGARPGAQMHMLQETTEMSRRARQESRSSILNEIIADSSRSMAPDGSRQSLGDDVKDWLAGSMRLDDPSGGGGSIDAPARSLIGPWDVGSAASVRALRALPVYLLYAARFTDAASLLTSLSYIEAMATTGNLFLVSDLLKSWLARANDELRASGASARGSRRDYAQTPESSPPSMFNATGIAYSHALYSAGLQSKESLASLSSPVGNGEAGSTVHLASDKQQSPRQQDVLRVVAASQFIAANAASIAQLPQILFQMAANLPSEHPLTRASDASWRLLSEGRSFFRHLNKPEQRDPCLATLVGHWAPVVAGQFDPYNGYYIITGSMDGRARLWDVRSGDCVALWDSAEHAPAVEMSSRPMHSRGGHSRGAGSGLRSPIVRSTKAGSPSGLRRRRPGRGTGGMVRRLSIATRILARVGVTSCRIRPQTNNIVALGLQDGRLVLWDYSQLLSKVLYGPERDSGGSSILNRKSIFQPSPASHASGSYSHTRGQSSNESPGSGSGFGNRHSYRRGSVDRSSTSAGASPSLKMLAAMHMPAHPASITALEWSDDGSHLCSGDAEGRVVLWSFNTEGALSFAQAEDQPLPVAAWRAVGGGIRQYAGGRGMSRMQRMSMATDSYRVHRQSDVKTIEESESLGRPRVHHGTGLRDAVRSISFVGPVAPMRPQTEASMRAPLFSGMTSEAQMERESHSLDRLVAVAGHRQVQLWDGVWRPGFVPWYPGESDEGSYGTQPIHGPKLVESDEDTSSSDDEALDSTGAMGGRRASFNFDDISTVEGRANTGGLNGNPLMSPVSKHFVRGANTRRDNERPDSKASAISSKSTRKSRQARVRQLHEYQKGGGFPRCGQIRLVASTRVRALHAENVAPSGIRSADPGSGSTMVSSNVQASASVSKFTLSDDSMFDAPPAENSYLAPTNELNRIIDTEWLTDLSSENMEYLLQSRSVQTPFRPSQSQQKVFMALLYPSNGGLDTVGLDYIMRLPPGISKPRLLLDSGDSMSLAKSSAKELPGDAAAALLAKSIMGRSTPADKRRIAAIQWQSRTMAEQASYLASCTRDRGAKAIVLALTDDPSTTKDLMLSGTFMQKSSNPSSVVYNASVKYSLLEAVAGNRNGRASPMSGSLGISRSGPRLGHSLSGMMHSYANLSSRYKHVSPYMQSAEFDDSPDFMESKRSMSPDTVCTDYSRGLGHSVSTPALSSSPNMRVQTSRGGDVSSIIDPVRARSSLRGFHARPIQDLTNAAIKSYPGAGAPIGDISRLRASAREFAATADQEDSEAMKRQLRSEYRFKSPIRRLPPALAGQSEGRQSAKQAIAANLKPVLGAATKGRAQTRKGGIVRQSLVPGVYRPPTSDPSVRYDILHSLAPALRGSTGSRTNGGADTLPPASFDESLAGEISGQVLQTGIEGTLGASARTTSLRRGKIGSQGVAQDADNGAAWIRQYSAQATSAVAGGNSSGSIKSLSLPVGSMLSTQALGRLGTIPLCASFSGLGRVTVGCSDGKARVFRIDDGTSCGVLAGHKDAVLQLAYSPSGRLLLTTSIDGLAKVWQPGLLANGYRELPHSAPVRGVGISRYLNVYKAATADERGNIKVIDLDGRKIASLSMRSAFGDKLGGASTSAADAADAAMGKTHGSTGSHSYHKANAPIAPERTIFLDFVHGGTRLITISGSGAAVWPLPYLPRSAQTEGAQYAQILEDPEFFGKHVSLSGPSAAPAGGTATSTSGGVPEQSSIGPTYRVAVTKSVLSSLRTRGTIRQRDKKGAGQQAAAFSREVASSESRNLAITPALPPQLQRLEAGLNSSSQADGAPLQGKSSGTHELGGDVYIGGQVRKAHVLCRSPVDCWSVSPDGGTLAIARSADDYPWASSQKAFGAKRPGTVAMSGQQTDRERVFAGRKRGAANESGDRDSDAGYMIELFDTINGKRFEALLPPGVSTDASGAGAKPDPTIRARSLAFSPDGTILVAACSDGTIRCVILHELLSRRATASGARAAAGAFAASRGQSSWAEGPHVLVLGDIRSAASALAGAASVADHAVKSCHFSPTANYLMCLSASPRIAVWRFAQTEEPDDVDPQEVQRQRKETSDASVGARRGSMMLADKLITATEDGPLVYPRDKLESIRMNTPAQKDPEHHSMVQLYGEAKMKGTEWKTSSEKPQARPSVATILQLYAPPGSMLPAAARNKISLEELVERENNPKLEIRGRDGRRRGIGVGKCEYLEGHVVAPDDAAWCPHGQRIISCSKTEDTVAVFHVPSKTVLAVADIPQPTQVTWSSDGVRIVVGTENHKVYVLVNTHQSTFTQIKLRVCSLWMPRTSVVTSVGFSASGTHCVLGDALGNVDLLRHESGFTLKGSIDWLRDDELEQREHSGREPGTENTSSTGDERDREYPLQRSLPVCAARRIYYPDRRLWGNRTEAYCDRCGFVFRVPAKSLGAAATVRKTAQRFGWMYAHLHDSRLQVRCSRCRKLHRLSPLVISTVAGSTTAGKAS